jgi:hypothetical protein
MWLLDRLAPEADNAMLEPLLDDSRGVYAWGRRLPPERRQELPQLKFPLSDQTWKRTRYLTRKVNCCIGLRLDLRTRIASRRAVSSLVE